VKGWQPTEEAVRYAYGLAFRLTGDEDAAGDLAQDGLLAAWKARETLAETGSSIPWLRRIVVNAFLMGARSSATRKESEFPDGDPTPFADLSYAAPDAVFEMDEAIRSIRDGCFFAMARNLTGEQRCAFVLADMAGLGAAEAAALMSIGTAAYRGLLHRARANINAFFGDHCSLVRPENPCSCAEWIRLVADRDALRSAVAQREGPPPFADPAYASRGDIATAPTVLALFRSIPDRLPSSAWFDRAGATLAALRSAL
jgi:DNA-directed RNA polymerase specialized sigma24 family protein